MAEPQWLCSLFCLVPWFQLIKVLYCGVLSRYSFTRLSAEIHHVFGSFPLTVQVEVVWVCFQYDFAEIGSSWKEFARVAEFFDFSLICLESFDIPTFCCVHHPPSFNCWLSVVLRATHSVSVIYQFSYIYWRFWSVSSWNSWLSSENPSFLHTAQNFCNIIIRISHSKNFHWHFSLHSFYFVGSLWPRQVKRHINLCLECLRLSGQISRIHEFLSICHFLL